MPRGIVEVTPSASRLTTSLRDIGYDFTAALADLVDNSIAAGARHVAVDFQFQGSRSHIAVTDDGHGMTPKGVEEALRFGSRRRYDSNDLGRFGLGLKTASLSQCRRVTVMSRHSDKVRRVTARTLDLDLISESDRWYLSTPYMGRKLTSYRDASLSDGRGTVVLLEKLDRVFEGVDPDSGWARRRLRKLADEASLYLGMVFHRFIEGTASVQPLTITVDGGKVEPWNPFAPDEEGTMALPVGQFMLESGGAVHEVTLRPYVLPPRASFSSPAEFERLGGPNRWNRQQGLYIYRAGRLVQSGGWSGLRSVDEHTKLARAALEFPTALDEAFKINVAKMRVSVPDELRVAISRPINEVCATADATYRSSGTGVFAPKGESAAKPSADLRQMALAFEAAAIRSGLTNEWDQLLEEVRDVDASLIDAMGL